MSSDEPVEDDMESKRSQFGRIFSKGLDYGIAWSKDEALKSKAKLEKAVGLGQTPDVIPPGEADIKSQPRSVQLGWHPVAGLSGRWFAEKTSLGKYITKEVGKYPDPTQHWAVLVDGYAHQLWMDENLDIIYTNMVVDPAEWHTFHVGNTTFNDQAMREASEMVIHNMRTARPAYNLISNNCQNFAVNLLQAVQIGGHRDFGTTFAIYQRVTGKGRIKDLFSDPPPEQQQQADPQASHDAAVGFAQQIMDENTTKLDEHHRPVS